jgi:hypothetical protein
MSDFPRTTVGGVSLPRMIIGTNWFRGYSHTTKAKDCFIREYMTPKRVADILTVFLEAGVDAVIGGDMDGPMPEALAEAEQRAGRKIIRIITPGFNTAPGGPPEREPERVIARCAEVGGTFCFPHQGVVDALVDRRARVIRDIDVYTKMIRDHRMIPGLSTHMPETVRFADNQGADVETYVQLYNAAGFLMQVEVDWIHRIIHEAKKPVLTIKPMAAGRLLPLVGLAFSWATIRDCDMVAVGTTTPDEAREDIEISLAVLEKRAPGGALQESASKKSLKE